MYYLTLRQHRFDRETPETWVKSQQQHLGTTKFEPQTKQKIKIRGAILTLLWNKLLPDSSKTSTSQHWYPSWLVLKDITIADFLLNLFSYYPVWKNIWSLLVVHLIIELWVPSQLSNSQINNYPDIPLAVKPTRFPLYHNISS